MPTFKFHALLDYNTDSVANNQTPPLCYVKDKEVADRIAQHPAYYKPHGLSNKPVSTNVVEREVPFFESLDQFLEWKGELQSDKLLHSALGKLSAEEVEALKKNGLTIS